MSGPSTVLADRAAPSGRGRSPAALLSGALRFTRKQPLGAFGAVAIVVLLALAVAPALFAPYDPYAQDPLKGLRHASSLHLFGTDNFGRDMLSRVIYGARTSIYIGFGAVAVGIAAATLVGALSAYAGSLVDAAVQRVVDALMALPWLILLMSVMALVGPGATNTMLVIGFLTIPGNSRVIRGSVLQLKQNQYVEAARACGCSHTRILLRYILPNITAELIVLASIGIGSAILAESSLSFLGYGVVPPTPAWGYMLGIEGRRFLTTAPWLAIFPGAAIALCVFAFNMVGDALRDVLDPRLRGGR